MTLLAHPVGITANRLDNGGAVWMNASLEWTHSFQGLAIFKTVEARDAALARALQTEAENTVVEPYEIEISITDSQPSPVRFREKIRTAGPTVRAEHGYQAFADPQSQAA